MRLRNIVYSFFCLALVVESGKTKKKKKIDITQEILGSGPSSSTPDYPADGIQMGPAVGVTAQQLQDKFHDAGQQTPYAMNHPDPVVPGTAYPEPAGDGIRQSLNIPAGGVPYMHPLHPGDQLHEAKKRLETPGTVPNGI
ncbi:unnamed protein product [Clonostachys byssicola]|uniref:Uncharacterized protein n=1 Tax=Clonostachys byssicola TaxID=160290 RepID=A0A9N9U0U0_9HYPO|nr:unnamed protein product [Clonostachys byssicola]